MATKVFIGNLSFHTTEDQLSKEFSAAGKVVGVNIITRGTRSLGYGFVEMESLDSAKRAVEKLDKKEVDGRQINVEIAKPRDEAAEAARRAERAERRARPPRPAAAAAADGGENNGDDGQRRFQRRRPAYRNGPPSAGGPSAGGDRPRGGNRDGGNRDGGNRDGGHRDGGNRDGGNRDGGHRDGGAPRRERQQRPPRENNPDRPPSETTLFIANLPFSLTDEQFNKMFADAGLKVKSAHVVIKINGKSKGFGFAEFNNKEEQQKALQALTGKKLDDRELSVKVALSERPANAAGGAPAAPATGAAGKQEQ